MLQPDKPLYLPKGSVRAVIALGVVGAYVVGQVTEEIALLVLGFYFGSRGSGTS
jgi:hypothetical protein